MQAVLNALAMNINFLACVLGAAHDMPLLGLPVTAAVIALRLYQTDARQIEIMLMSSALLMGLIVDSLLAIAGLLEFTSGTIVAGLTTPWMLALWVGFATTFRSSFRFAMGTPIAAAILGAIVGPIAYGSALAFGAVRTENWQLAAAIVVPCFTACCVILQVLMSKLEGQRLRFSRA